MLTTFTPTDDLGTYGGFTLAGYFKGLRRDVRGWDYFLTVRPPGGGSFSVHAHALAADGDALLRLYGAAAIDRVLAHRAKREAMWLIDRGTWEMAAIHRLAVLP